MDWSKGFSSRYYGTYVDSTTWDDIGFFDIISGSVSNSDSELIESADITCGEFDQSKEYWVRIYLDARQEGTGGPYHEAIFTGLTGSPSKKINGYVINTPVQCYSVLKPASDIFLKRGWYVSKNSNGAEIIKNLLSATPAPVTIEGTSPNLQETIIAEDNETNLSMALKILNSIGWRIKISGRGEITICKYASIDDVSVIFDHVDNDCIETEIEIENDWYSCPNAFRAIQGDLIGEAYNNDENDPISIVNREREVWMQETSCTLGDGESINSYAARRLEEESQVATILSYKRRYYPDVKTTDIIRISYPKQNITGLYYISSQTINLGYGATVSEVANKINGL